MLLLLLLENLINPLLTSLYIGSKPGLIGGFLLAFVLYLVSYPGKQKMTRLAIRKLDSF